MKFYPILDYFAQVFHQYEFYFTTGLRALRLSFFPMVCAHARRHSNA